jgi:hypothetical protein
MFNNGPMITIRKGEQVRWYETRGRQSGSSTG